MRRAPPAPPRLPCLGSGFRAGDSAGGQGAAEEREHAAPVALQPGSGKRNRYRIFGVTIPGLGEAGGGPCLPEFTLTRDSATTSGAGDAEPRGQAGVRVPPTGRYARAVGLRAPRGRGGRPDRGEIPSLRADGQGPTHTRHPRRRTRPTPRPDVAGPGAWGENREVSAAAGPPRHPVRRGRAPAGRGRTRTPPPHQPRDVNLIVH